MLRPISWERIGSREEVKSPMALGLLLLQALQPAAALHRLGPGAVRRFGADVTRAATPRMGVTSDELGVPCIGDCAVGSYPNMPDSVHPGVLTGQACVDLLNHAKANGYAIPAVNCVTSSSVNACLEAARKADAPIIIQFSSGGSQFYAGKGLDNTGFKAAIAGAVSGAFHVRAMAEQYGVPVILHTDHCAKNLLPWLDGSTHPPACMNRLFARVLHAPLQHVCDAGVAAATRSALRVGALLRGARRAALLFAHD